MSRYGSNAKLDAVIAALDKSYVDVYRLGDGTVRVRERDEMLAQAKEGK